MNMARTKAPSLKYFTSEASAQHCFFAHEARCLYMAQMLAASGCQAKSSIDAGGDKLQKQNCNTKERQHVGGCNGVNPFTAIRGSARLPNSHATFPGKTHCCAEATRLL